MSTILDSATPNTPETPSTLLAHQLSGVCARLCESTNDNELVSTTMQLVLEALEAGKVSLDMSSVRLPPGAGSLETWQQKLIKAGVAENPGGFAPLIVDNGHLYLARYYLYHSTLNQRLNQLATETVETVDIKETKDTLNRLFPEN